MGWEAEAEAEAGDRAAAEEAAEACRTCEGSTTPRLRPRADEDGKRSGVHPGRRSFVVKARRTARRDATRRPDPLDAPSDDRVMKEPTERTR